jgi:hypothetical protein
MQWSPYISKLVRKYNSGVITPEETELLEEAGFFDEDEMDDAPYDSPSLQDEGKYLGSYGD